MSDTSTMDAPGTDAHQSTGYQTTAQQATGHGKHRGPVSGHDDAATPQGRHRKPSDQDSTV